MKLSFKENRGNWFAKIIMLGMFIIIPYLTGCASTAIETHKKGMESLAEKEYFIPKRPIDRHYIGCAWSKQFGPVEDPSTADIRVKVDKSFNAVQQNFAYNVGLSLGGESVIGPKGETGIQAGKATASQMEDVQIIGPVSLADIPFEPNTPYITEALRLGNFRLKSESAKKAGISASADSPLGSASAGSEVATQGGASLSGEGLVIAYKLQMIDSKSYKKDDPGSVNLELDKTMQFPKANLLVKAQLRVIDPGANRPLPRNLLWSCDRADAKSKDMVAAWIIELKPTDPRRKSLNIAFPGFPKIEDCQNYSGVIYSRIDAVTDRIIRQKISITILEAELSDSLRPQKWEAKVSIVDESFNIKPVKPGDAGNL